MSSYNRPQNFEPWSEASHAEIHSRPEPVLKAPARIIYLGISNGGAFRNEVSADFDMKCKGLVFESTLPDVRIFRDEELEVHVVFHSEYVGITMIFPLLNPNNPFDCSDIDEKIQYWKNFFPNPLITAVKICLKEGESDLLTREKLTPIFGDHQIVGAKLADGYLRVWNAFRLNDDGYVKILVESCNSRERRNGRIVQRLLDIEIYRVLSLKCLPLAKELIPSIKELNKRLGKFLTDLSVNNDVEHDQNLLTDLLSFSVEVEALRSKYANTYSSIISYQHILNRRVVELRESRIEGFQNYGEFLLKRLDPSFQTCASVDKRIQTLSERMGAATNLLRTKVNVHMETQNQKILQSFDARVETQLNLQETVEGLSIIALTYYGLGLLKIIITGIKSMGLNINSDITLLICAPFLIVVIWFFAHRLSVRLSSKLKNEVNPIQEK